MLVRTETNDDDDDDVTHSVNVTSSLIHYALADWDINYDDRTYFASFKSALIHYALVDRNFSDGVVTQFRDIICSQIPYALVERDFIDDIIKGWLLMDRKRPCIHYASVDRETRYDKLIPVKDISSTLFFSIMLQWMGR